MKRWVLCIIFCLFFSLHLLAQNPSQELGLSSPPGRYSRDVILQIQPELDFSDILFRYTSAGQSDFARYTDPLVLRTPENTQYRYEIELLLVRDDKVIRREFIQYTIDKIPPGPVRLDRPAGRYMRRGEFSPLASDAEEFEVTISSGASRRELRLNEGEHFKLDGTSGKFTPYAIRVYALDEAGNRSQPSDFRIEIDRRQEIEADAIPIVSPVPGDFANRQLLYIDDRGFSALTYTLDGKDPRLGGRSYSNPVLLPAGNDIRLRIHGTTHNGEHLHKDIVFSAADGNYGSLEQGSVSRPLQVPAVRSGLFYRADDRNEVSRFDSPLDRPLRIRPQEGSLRALPLRILDSRDNREYRYLFLLDGRRPRLPALDLLYFNQAHDDFVSVSETATVSRRLRIRSSTQNEPGIRLFYTLDGSAPSAESDGNLKEIFLDEEILLPGDRTEIQLRIQARKNESSWSEVYARDLSISSPPDYSLEITEAREDNQITLNPVLSGQTAAGSSGYRLSFSSGEFRTGLIPADTSLELPLLPGSAADREMLITRYSSSGTESQEILSRNLNLSEGHNIGPRIGIDGEQISITAQENHEILKLDYRAIRIPDPLKPDTFKGDEPDETVSGSFRKYDSPFSLPVSEGSNINFIIEARSHHENGSIGINRSGIVPVHRREPSSAEIVGAIPGAAVSENPIELDIHRPEPGVRYYYSVGRNGRQAEPPDTESPWTLRSLQLRISPDRSDEQISIRVLPVSQGNPSLRGSESRFDIRYDTIPPSPPEVSGVDEGVEYGQTLEFRLSSDEGNRIIYKIRRKDAEQSIEPESVYAGPVTLPGVDGRRIIYELRAQSVDPAGNTSEPVEISFALDREKPELPGLRIYRQGEVIKQQLGQYIFRSSDNLRIEFESDESVLYELSRDGTPPVPGTASSRSGKSLELQGVPGSELTYTLLFRSRDSAGNLGEVSNSFEFTIDKENPDPPPEPEISRDGNSGKISWATADENKIEYALVSGLDRTADEFSPYEAPFEWQIPDDFSRMRLLYRAVDNAGNRSRIQERVLPRLQIAAVPKVSGIQDGAVYTSSQSIQVYPSSDGIVRYEISSDGTDPEAVDQRSTIWNSRLDFQAAEGETVQYRIRLRQFIPGYEPSRELQFSFTLDKTPPLPPAISGLSTQEYLHEDQNIRMSVENEGQVVYQLRSYIYDSGNLPREWDRDFVAPSSMSPGEFENYTEPFTLQADPGELKLYTIRGYSYDRAGNRSAQDRSWNIIIDKRNVFVDPSRSETGNGSRSEPFNRLATAVGYAGEHNLSEIYLQSGNYPLDAPLSIPMNLGIYGSFDTFWESDSDEDSYLYADKSFRGESLIDTRASSLVLDSVFLSDSAKDLESLINSSGGSIDLSAIRMSVAGRSRGIESEKSRISLMDSQIIGYELEEGMLIKLRDSQLRMSNSLVSAEELPDFLDEGIHSSYILIHSQESQLDISSSRILPGSGDNTIALYLYNSSLDLHSNSVLGSGFGSSTANAVYGENSELRLRDSTVQGSRNAAVVSLLAVSNSDLELSRMELNLEANFGVKGILITGGRLAIEESSFQAVGAGDFVNAIHARNSAELSIHSSEFTGLITAEYTLALLEKSSGEFTGNRLALSGEEGFATAFQISGAGSFLIQDNSLSGISSAAAIRLQSTLSDISLEVASNTFENWGVLLEEFTDSFRSSARQAGRYQTLQELETLDNQGVIFSNNIINQGL